MVIRLMLFINICTKDSQMKHCTCPKYAVIYRPNVQNVETIKENSPKNN